MQSSELFRAALAGERRAMECYRQLRGHFEGHGFVRAAAICEKLAGLHEQGVFLLRMRQPSPEMPEPWLERGARELFLRLTSPRNVLLAPMVMEQSLRALYGRLEPMCPWSSDRALAKRLAARAARSLSQLRAVAETLPGGLDWRDLASHGTVPSLPPGAERRLHRTTRR